MVNILGYLLYVLIFFDNILVSLNQKKNYLQQLNLDLKLLQQINVIINVAKSHFYKTEVKLL